MEISPQSVVALTWTLKDSLADTLDELQEPVEFLVGGDDLLPAISAALQGHEAGATLDLNLEPEDAFGDFDEELVFLAKRDQLPDGLEEGMLLDAAALPADIASEAPSDAIFTITEIYPEHVVLDANHPLAGMALRLAVQVKAVREATEDEIAAQSVDEGAVSILSPVPGSQHLH